MATGETADRGKFSTFQLPRTVGDYKMGPLAQFTLVTSRHLMFLKLLIKNT